MSKNRLLMAMVVLLVFVAQAVASTVVPCDMESSNMSASMDMAMMDHSGHAMDDYAATPDSPTDTGSSDCCSQDCTCSMIGCSAIALPTEGNCSATVVLSQPISASRLSAFESQLQPTLYRPPIFC